MVPKAKADRELFLQGSADAGKFALIANPPILGGEVKLVQKLTPGFKPDVRTMEDGSQAFLLRRDCFGMNEWPQSRDYRPRHFENDVKRLAPQIGGRIISKTVEPLAPELEEALTS